MNSKEAYYILIQAWHGNKDTYDYPSFDDINEAFDVLKQDLERLEALEIENKELLVNKNVAQALAVKYRKAIEIIKSKVELELNLDEFWKGIRYHLWSGEGGCEITQQEYELLKEVLNND